MDLNRRHLLGAGLSAAGLGGSAGAQVLAPQWAPGAAPGRDLLIANAKIITLDARSSVAEAALVRDGRIVAVGNYKALRASASTTPQYDAGGRVVIPGFVDNHCHVESACVVADEEPSLHGSGSIAEMIAKLRARAAVTPKGEWVVMQGFPGDFPGGVTEKRWINRQDLDQASQDHPVMVLLGVHASVMNSLAWRQTGYWDGANAEKVRWRGDGSVRRGSFIHRDEAGHPSGLATEVWDFVPPFSVAQYKASVTRHFKDWFLAKGLTSITTLQDAAPAEMMALQALQQEGLLRARLRVYPMVPQAIALQDITRVGWRTGFGNEMFRFGGVKLFVDGAGSDFQGHEVADLKWTDQGLAEALTSCQQGQLQTIMHVVTKAGWAQALDALETAQRLAPAALRHRIDHLTMTDDGLIERARQLGVVCGVTAPRFKPGSRAAAGPGARLHRYRTLAEKGMLIAVLDAAIPGGAYHPMQGVANMIAELKDGGAAPEGEALTLEQALRAWTLWPAQANFEGHLKGSIEPGKLGDFTVLSQDPFNRAPAEVYDIGTTATIVGGEVVYQA